MNSDILTSVSVFAWKNEAIIRFSGRMNSSIENNSFSFLALDAANEKGKSLSQKWRHNRKRKRKKL